MSNCKCIHNSNIPACLCCDFLDCVGSIFCKMILSEGFFLRVLLMSIRCVMLDDDGKMTMLTLPL